MPGLVIFSFMSNILGLLPLVVLLQSSFWTESMEMGMGMLSGLQLSFGIARNRYQLGVVSVRGLGHFRNSFPQTHLPPRK